MRLSIEEGDYGYAAWERGEAQRPAGAIDAVRVFLRDACVESVVTADEEEGMLVRFCQNADGSLVLDGDFVRTEMLRGEVRIEYPAWWPQDCRA